MADSRPTIFPVESGVSSVSGDLQVTQDPKVNVCVLFAGTADFECTSGGSFGGCYIMLVSFEPAAADQGGYVTSFSSFWQLLGVKTFLLLFQAGITSVVHMGPVGI